MTTNRITATAAAAFMASLVHGQGFNIDLDIFFGPPELGNGAPSAAFGAAASQVGHWNRVSTGVEFAVLAGLGGASSNVTLAMTSSGGSGGGGFNNPANTGDYALLLNDAASVNAVVQGGRRTYTFTGLLAGLYELYTYAVNPIGLLTPTPIEVPLALSNPIQVVTGPMPGNSFAQLITHSLHLVQVEAGQSLFMECEIAPGAQNESFINGFQILPVPEPGTMWSVTLVCLYAIARRRKQR